MGPHISCGGSRHSAAIGESNLICFQYLTFISSLGREKSTAKLDGAIVVFAIPPGSATASAAAASAAADDDDDNNNNTITV